MEDYKKKYEELYEKISNLVRDYDCVSGLIDVREELKSILNESQESEDERIRKSLINYIDYHGNAGDFTKQEFIAWLEKQGEKVNAIENFDTEFERQISHLIASTINKEHEYNEGFVKWTANALLNYAKHVLKKQGEQKPIKDNCKISDCVETVDMTEYNKGYECGKQRVLKYPEEYGLCKKPAWSEDDERKINGIVMVLKSWDSYHVCSVGLPSLIPQYISWLDSLKERIKGE